MELWGGLWSPGRAPTASLYSRPGPLVPGGRGIQASLGVPEEREEETPATAEAEDGPVLQPQQLLPVSAARSPEESDPPTQSVLLPPHSWEDVEMRPEDTPGASSGRVSDMGAQAWALALAAPTENCFGRSRVLPPEPAPY